MLSFQSALSTAQAVPVLGPVFVSPCKAVVSLAQIIAGFAGGVIFGALTVVSFGSDWCAGKTFQSIGHVSMGFLALGYSFMNILTLGIAGYHIEIFRAGVLREAREEVAFA